MDTSVAMVRALYNYEHWVTSRLFSLAEQVPTEHTRESFGASFDSIHGTLAHILRGEMFYFSRFSGTTIDQRQPAELETIAELRAMWQEHWANLDKWVKEATPEQIAATVHYTRG